MGGPKTLTSARHDNQAHAETESARPTPKYSIGVQIAIHNHVTDFNQVLSVGAECGDGEMFKLVAAIQLICELAAKHAAESGTD